MLPDINLAQGNRALAVAVELVQAPVFVRPNKADVVEIHFVFSAVWHGRIALCRHSGIRSLDWEVTLENLGSSQGPLVDAVVEEVTQNTA